MTQEHSVAEQLCAGNGAVAGLMRSHDWSQTPLGAVETWTDSLKTAVQIFLTELDQSKETAEQSGAAIGRTADRTAQDITDRKQAEAQLRLANYRFQVAECASKGFFYDWNLETGEVIRSESLTRVLGYQLDELPNTAESWEALIHPDDRAAARETFTVQINSATGETAEAEYRVRHKNGEYCHVYDRALLLRDDHGQIVQVIGQTVDITKLKQTEQALRESENRFRSVANLVPDMLWDSEPNGSTNWYNQRWMEYTGQTFDQAIGWGWTDTIHPDDLEASARRYREAVETSRPLRQEHRIRRHDGEYRWFVVNIFPLKDESGQVVKVYGAATDIHEAYFAAAALRASEAKYRSLFDSIDEGFHLIELIDDEAGEVVDYRFLEGNLAFERLSGLKNAAGKLGSEIAPKTESYWLEAYNRVARTGEPLRMENYNEDTKRWYSAYISRVDSTGSRQVALVFDDISDRKRHEANLFFLAEISQDLVRLTNIDETMDAIGEKIAAHFNASVCGFSVIDEAAGTFTNTHVWHRVGVPRMLGTFRIDDYHSEELRRAMRAGETYFVSDTATDPRTNHANMAALGTGSFLTVPLVRDGEWRFNLSIADTVPRDWRDDEIELMRELTTRLWTRLERARAEAALRESESRLRLMIESAREYAILTLDLDGQFTSWNSGAERLLGYAEAEILGQSGRIIFTPEDNAQGKAELEMHLAQTEEQAENRRWHVRKDGSRFWGTGFVMPLRNGDDVIHGFIKIMRDETAQRQAEERFQALYDTTSDLLATEQPLMLMHNLFSNLSAQLDLDYYVNRIVAEKDDRPMLHLKNYQGLAEAEAEAIEWLEFGQDLCGLVAQERHQIVLDQAELTHHPKAQRYRSLGITAYAGQPLIVQGRLLGTLCFASRSRTHFTSDETNLLQSVCDQMAIALERSHLLNSIQQQAEQLKQANQIKDEFLAVLSHELRTPLNPILGWATLLRRGKLDAARTKTALGVIERNAQLQSQLINDLLDISRILQGKLSLAQTSVDLSVVISAALETVRLAAEAKALQIEIAFPSNVRAVLGDAGRLQQVIWNLFSNAVKFTSQGGQITVALTQSDTHAQIQVTDTGKGINPEFLPYVFEHFRQEDGATTRKFGGLGLGLAIVRQIVEMHGGTIAAHSLGEGQGATFTLHLPLAPCFSERLSTESSPDSSGDLTGTRILVVDDETDSREFVAFVLEQAGAIVTSTASGIEALQVVEQSVPDLIVSDIGMPEMDGYMLLQQIRAIKQAKSIPAIALTAYAGEFDRQQALKAGFQQHLSKPIELNELIQAIVGLI